jgi:hypothetical protein
MFDRKLVVPAAAAALFALSTATLGQTASPPAGAAGTTPGAIGAPPNNSFIGSVGSPPAIGPTPGLIGVQPNNSFIGSGIGTTPLTGPTPLNGPTPLTGPTPLIGSTPSIGSTPLIGTTPLIFPPPSIGTTPLDSNLGNSSAGASGAFGTTPVAPVTPSQPFIGSPRVCPNGMTIC